MTYRIISIALVFLISACGGGGGGSSDSGSSASGDGLNNKWYTVLSDGTTTNALGFKAKSK